MLCSLATNGLRRKHKYTGVRRRLRGQRLTVTVQSQCQKRLSSSRIAAIAQTVEPSASRLDSQSTSSTIEIANGSFLKRKLFFIDLHAP